jgi:hypothetical protein
MLARRGTLGVLNKLRRKGAAMKRVKGVSPLVRVASIISIILAMVTGVTYAALQSQNVKLSGNSIQSATANLLIGTSLGSMGNSSVGFTFPNVEPGGAAVPAAGNVFYLKNSGTTDLTLHMSIDQFSNSGNVDLMKVHIILTPTSGAGGSPQMLSLGALIDAYNSGGVNLGLKIASNTSASYEVRATMDADAMTGGPSSGATIGGIEFVFSGVTSTS